MAAVHQLIDGCSSDRNGPPLGEPSKIEPQISETWSGVVHLLWQIVSLLRWHLQGTWNLLWLIVASSEEKTS